MTYQCAHDSGVGDYCDFGVLERSGEVQCPPLQRGNRFATRRGETEDVAGPGVELGALDIIPAPALPFSEIDFAQAVVDERIRR